MLTAFPAMLGIRPTLRQVSLPEAAHTACRWIRPFNVQRSSHSTASVPSRCRPVLRASQTDASEANTSLSTLDLRPVHTADGSLNDFPQTAGVYSVHSPDGELQYIGLSRKVLHS